MLTLAWWSPTLVALHSDTKQIIHSLLVQSSCKQPSAYCTTVKKLFYSHSQICVEIINTQVSPRAFVLSNRVSVEEKRLLKIVAHLSLCTNPHRLVSWTCGYPARLFHSLCKPRYESCVFSSSLMHLRPAASTHIQPHIRQDMGFSMLSRSGPRGFPVSNYTDCSSQKYSLVEKGGILRAVYTFHIVTVSFDRQ